MFKYYQFYKGDNARVSKQTFPELHVAFKLLMVANLCYQRS